LATQEGDFVERRRQILHLYVEQMFQRKGTTSLVFPKEKIIAWLSWLAGKMKEHSLSVFLVEGLQPSWLGTRAKRVAYRAVVFLSLGLLFGLYFGLILGLFFDTPLNQINLVETISWNWRGARDGLRGSLLVELIIGMLGGLIFGMLGGLATGMVGGGTALLIIRVGLVLTAYLISNFFN
jgi:hypothetical protein